jgi:hypothetical protein
MVTWRSSEVMLHAAQRVCLGSEANRTCANAQ